MINLRHKRKLTEPLTKLIDRFAPVGVLLVLCMLVSEPVAAEGIPALKVLEGNDGGTEYSLSLQRKSIKRWDPKRWGDYWLTRSVICCPIKATKSPFSPVPNQRGKLLRMASRVGSSQIPARARSHALACSARSAG